MLGKSTSHGQAGTCINPSPSFSSYFSEEMHTVDGDIGYLSFTTWLTTYCHLSMDSALLFFIYFLFNHITISLKVQCSILKVMLLTDASSGYN
jgi:hypothetical protein